MVRMVKAKSSPYRTWLLIAKIVVVSFFGFLSHILFDKQLQLVVLIPGVIIILSILSVREHTLTFDGKKLTITKHGYFNLFKKNFQFPINDIRSIHFKQKKDVFKKIGNASSQYAWDILSPSGNSKIILDLKNNESKHFSCYASQDSLRRLFYFLHESMKENESPKL